MFGAESVEYILLKNLIKEEHLNGYYNTKSIKAEI